MRGSKPVLTALVLALVGAACSSATDDPSTSATAGSSPPCSREFGKYPPSTITFEVAATAVEVPLLYWECLGYNADTFLDPTPVPGIAGDRAVIRLTVEAGTTITVTAHDREQDGSTALPVESLNGDGWALVLPAGGVITMRICAADGRCAGYQVQMERPREGPLRVTHSPPANFSWNVSTRPAMGTRTCSMVSRSRMVTAWSWRLSKSTVTAKGVPISSWRR